MEIKIADAIRNNSLNAYQLARYPYIQDGEPVVFINEDFSTVDFNQFSAGFFEFINCNLDSVTHLYGQPIRIEGGTARGIDLRGVRAIIKAANCDFTGLLYDNDTELAYDLSKGGARSEFSNCQLDQQAQRYLSKQGVIFKT